MTVRERRNETALHQDSLVVDALGPLIGPRVYNPSMLQRLDGLVAAGASQASISAELDELFDAELRAGRLQEYWDAWLESGVDVTSATVVGHGPDLFSYEGAIGGLARWQSRFDAYPDKLLKVVSRSDIDRARLDNKHGVILGFQNSTHFGDDLGLLERFYRLGIRIVQITYNSRNLLGDGCTERNPAGLSYFGIAAIKRMNELGILIDVSHTSAPTTLDAVAASDRPIAVTHGFARAVHDHDRGQSDAVLRAVGREGFVGVCLVPFFLSSNETPTLDDFLRHIDHIVSLVGVEHVGIGTDWAGPFPPALAAKLDGDMAGRGFRPEHRMRHSATIRGFDRWADWPNLTAVLLSHGFSDDEVRGLIGANFVRTFEAAVG